MLEDLRGIEGLFETLCMEADEAKHSQVKYKELGANSSSSESKNCQCQNENGSASNEEETD